MNGVEWDSFHYGRDRDEEDVPRRKPTGCACFPNGDAPGTCPGQENCPMCEEDSEGEGDDDDDEEEEDK